MVLVGRGSRLVSHTSGTQADGGGSIEARAPAQLPWRSPFGRWAACYRGHGAKEVPLPRDVAPPGARVKRAELGRRASLVSEGVADGM